MDTENEQHSGQSERSEAKQQKPVVSNTRYWLCCGSLDRAHQDKRAKNCLEARMGHQDHCRWGTIVEHSEWAKRYY